MRKIIFFQILLCLTGTSCKTKEHKIVVPDMSSNFRNQLNRRDPALSLDSFYLIGIDTLNQKKSLTFERFPLMDITNRLNVQIESIYKRMDTIRKIPESSDLEKINNIKEEKMYIKLQLDSINRLLMKADSTIATGYAAFYKVTISKPQQFSISDTILYAISLQMKIADWDRFVEKSIDSLVVGKRSHRFTGYIINEKE